MRTTFELDDTLFRKAKAQAAMEGISLKDLLERGVKLALEPSQPEKKRHRVKLPLWGDKKAGVVKIPSNIVHLMDDMEDRQRHEASLRR